MKQKIIFNSVLNSLSIGQTGKNILSELLNRDDLDVKFHAIPGSQIDLSAFPKDEEFEKKLQRALDTRFEIFAETPSIKLWHIHGSQERTSRVQHLFTFNEVDSISPTERNILNLQDSVLTSSSESIKVFGRGGVTAKMAQIPLGLDPNIKKNNKDYKFGDKIHFGLAGKIEKRKATAEILRIWAKNYGNNSKYHLSCAIHNQFVKPEDFQNMIHRIFEGKMYHNISFLNFLSVSEMNDYYNAIDIELGGLSNAEGWGLCQFNAVSMGKWCPVTNVTGHRDWATPENSILIEPDGTQPAADGVFFSPNSPWNNGNIYYFSPEKIEWAMKEAEKRAKTINHAGLEMGERLTYKNTVDLILKNILS